MRSKIVTVMLWAAGLAAASCMPGCSAKGGDTSGSGGRDDGAVNPRGGSSPNAGTSGSVDNADYDLPTCDTAENNLSAWGFAETPFTMTGQIPVLSINGPLPDAAYNALLFETSIEAGTNGAGAITVNLISPAGEIASGNDVRLGNGAKLLITGLLTTAEGTSNFSCTGDSGEARINSLSVSSIASLRDIPDQENVSFVVNCTGDDTKPAGTEQVRGCYNLVKATD